MHGHIEESIDIDSGHEHDFGKGGCSPSRGKNLLKITLKRLFAGKKGVHDAPLTELMLPYWGFLPTYFTLIQDS